MGCTTIEQLFALTQNQMPADEVKHVRRHLDTGCAACQQRWHQLHMLLAVTAGRNLLELPDWLIHQAMNMFAWHKTESRQNGRARVPAFLLVDSFADGQLLGFRSLGPMTRQVLYRAGDYDIDLSIDRVGQHSAMDILGQTLPLRTGLSAVAEAEVQLLKGSRIAFGTLTNEFGEFIFGGIPEGVYDLRIALKAEELDIVGLHVVSHPN